MGPTKNLIYTLKEPRKELSNLGRATDDVIIFVDMYVAKSLAMQKNEGKSFK